jgi:hypothetical protein
MAQLVNPPKPRYIITSHSIDGTFESCPRRFEFRHIYEEFPLQETMGLAAEVGTALHEATQEWTKEGNITASDLTLLKFWPWKLEDKRRDSGLIDHRRTLGNAFLLLEAIRNDSFWQDWEVARLPDGKYAIELPWRIDHISLGSFPHPVHGTPVYLATQGKIDWVLRHRRQRNRYMVCDLKTTILGEQAQQASFRFSGQAGQYGFVLSEAIGLPWREEGMDVTYFIAEFGEHGLPETNPQTYHLESDEIFESIEAKNERLRRMIDMGQRGFWPRRSHGCSFYGTPCGFLDVCHRREPEFLQNWFAAERQDFRKESRIYEPYWVLEA